MPTIPMDIIEFIEHPDMLNDRSLSETQKVILRSIYGLRLTQTELDIYYDVTGRESYEAKEQKESSIIAGRRSGKQARSLLQ